MQRRAEKQQRSAPNSEEVLPLVSIDFGPKFPLGRTVITKGASGVLVPDDVKEALHRHSRGDWGELDAPDKKANVDALKDGGRLFSVYRDRNGVRFYIITEEDRAYTTILLPEEY